MKHCTSCFVLVKTPCTKISITKIKIKSKEKGRLKNVKQTKTKNIKIKERKKKQYVVSLKNSKHILGENESQIFYKSTCQENVPYGEIRRDKGTPVLASTQSDVVPFESTIYRPWSIYTEESLYGCIGWSESRVSYIITHIVIFLLLFCRFSLP